MIIHFYPLKRNLVASNRPSPSLGATFLLRYEFVKSDKGESVLRCFDMTWDLQSYLVGVLSLSGILSPGSSAQLHSLVFRPHQLSPSPLEAFVLSLLPKWRPLVASARTRQGAPLMHLESSPLENETSCLSKCVVSRLHLV